MNARSPCRGQREEDDRSVRKMRTEMIAMPYVVEITIPVASAHPQVLGNTAETNGDELTSGGHHNKRNDTGTKSRLFSMESRAKDMPLQ